MDDSISVIIPTHKRLLKVTQLLKSLEEQDFPKESLQVLLISNLADPALRQKVPDWDKIFYDFRYLEVGQKGVNKARNMGIRFALGDVLYFLDDDCLLPQPQHLKNILKAHKDYPLAVGIGGPYHSLNRAEDSAKESFYQDKSNQWLKDSLFNPSSSNPPSPPYQGGNSTGKVEYKDKGGNTISKILNRDKGGNPASKAGSFENKTPVFQSRQLLGGNASYKRRVFDQGYYFDSRIIFGGSELSFNDSLKEEVLLFNKDLWVYHQLDLTGPSLLKKAFKQGQGSVRFIQGDPQKKLPAILKQNWAFVSGTSNSFYSILYQSSFKLGYFWEISQLKNRKAFSLFRFLFVILKSRWHFIQSLLSWLYGKSLAYLLGPLWYGTGYLNGLLLKYVLGPLYFGLGWFYEKVLLFLFHHSPPMKMYYFSRYQYESRIKPWLLNRRKSKNTPLGTKKKAPVF